MAVVGSCFWGNRAFADTAAVVLDGPSLDASAELAVRDVLGGQGWAVADRGRIEAAAAFTGHAAGAVWKPEQVAKLRQAAEVDVAIVVEARESDNEAIALRVFAVRSSGSASKLALVDAAEASDKAAELVSAALSELPAKAQTPPSQPPPEESDEKPPTANPSASASPPDDADGSDEAAPEEVEEKVQLPTVSKNGVPLRNPRKKYKPLKREEAAKLGHSSYLTVGGIAAVGPTLIMPAGVDDSASADFWLDLAGYVGVRFSNELDSMVPGLALAWTNFLTARGGASSQLAAGVLYLQDGVIAYDLLGTGGRDVTNSIGLVGMMTAPKWSKGAATWGLAFIFKAGGSFDGGGGYIHFALGTGAVAGSGLGKYNVYEFERRRIYDEQREILGLDN